MVKSNGTFAFEILTSVGRESLSSFHRFIAQSNKKTYGRIADMLLYFSRVVFSSTKFQIPLSRREVADMESSRWLLVFSGFLLLQVAL